MERGHSGTGKSAASGTGIPLQSSLRAGTHARKWLNKTFYQEAFSKKDRSYIKLSSVKNNCSQNNTQDYLFYPSVSELTNEEYGFKDDESRKTSTTDYGSGSNNCYFTRDVSWLILGSPMDYYGVYGFNGTIHQYAFLWTCT